MDGNADPLSLALALVEEAKARCEEGDDGGGTMDFGRERGGGPRLVVVLEEAGHVVLEVEAREEVLADGPRVTLFQAVVEPLVVGVVEALLLEGPLEVPVDFGHEEEARDPGADGLRDPGPERRCGDPPRPLEDFRKDEHRHVASDAVALAGDPDEL